MDVSPATATAATRADSAKPGSRAPLEDLFDGVDDLIKRVADSENLEIRKIRAKVHASMMVARNACEDRGNLARRSAARMVKDADAHMGADDYSGDAPDEALGVALLVGMGLGVIMSTQP